MRKACWIFGVLILGLALFPQFARAISVDDVIELLKSGVGEQVILEQMNAEGGGLHLTTEDILDLKSAGASDDLIREIIRRGAAQPPSASDGSDASPDVSLHFYYDPFDYYRTYWPYATGWYAPTIWWGWDGRFAGWRGHRWVGSHPMRQHWNGHPSYPGPGHTTRPRDPRGAWNRGDASGGHGGTRPQPPAQSPPSRSGSDGRNNQRQSPPSRPDQPSRPVQPSPPRSAWGR